MTAGPPGRDLPTGTVTFLFTDVEGSTRLLQQLGSEWPSVLDQHNRILRDAIRRAGGVDVRTEGDAFFAVFSSATGAASAAITAQKALATHPWSPDAPIRVRMGLHTGEGAIGGDDYVGLDVHRAARIAAAGHGGQLLVSAATAELIGGALTNEAGLRDLGHHRLKDLARPERIYELTADGLPAAFPPLRSLETPTNLPPERTPFVGRRREVDALKGVVRGGRLVTLTGPGGTGKTRLALRTARELLSEHPDGVFLVELGAVADARLVAATIADAVGVRAERQRAILDVLREHLATRHMLLVLDNFEQVLDAAPVVSGLLETAPGLAVVVTSRERLHLEAEQEVPVPPLSIPTAPLEDIGPDLAERSDAVALFVQRAGVADRGFSLTRKNAMDVAELCRRLDGLPLAIELAASRVKLLSPAAILERLEHRLELLTGGPVDAPARQRTLREAIAWSYELLDTDEQAAFRRLSVFAGGWELDAAEAMAGSEEERGGDVLDVLGSLVDKSLVVRMPDRDRFRMLETIREFGLRALDAARESDPIRDRHADWYLRLAQRAAPHLRGRDQKLWLDRLELEHDNLRAALAHAIGTGAATIALRLISALWRFWHLHGHLGEGRRWAEDVVRLPSAAPRTADRFEGLTALGGVAYWQEDVPAFRAAYEESLELARELGDPTAEAEASYNLSFAPAMEGDLEGAVRLVEDARARFEELGIRRGVGDTLWFLAIVARLHGDLDGSRALSEEGLRIHGELGDRFGRTVGLYALARTALEQGDLETVRASLQEALTNDEMVGNRTGMGVIFDNLAARARLEENHLRALRLGGASEAIKEAAGGQAPHPLIDLPDPRDAARAVLGEAAVEAAWNEGRAMSLQQAIAYARQED
jgi:predicted ATPase/class 3 adenylate cyclase